MAQVALGVVGGVIGFMLGGPAGAAIGFSIGMALTPDMPGQQVGEIAAQTAKEGTPRLIVWGIVRPVGPNIIAAEDPPREVNYKRGGALASVRVTDIRRTYALGVCEGPITGYRRIWRNNKLVYDGRNGSEWGELNNPVFMERATFYYGDYSQLPDPDLEAVFGVGEVPAHRGTAYIVIKDETLNDTGGAVPQWLFEVYRGGQPIPIPRPADVPGDAVNISADLSWYVKSSSGHINVTLETNSQQCVEIDGESYCSNTIPLAANLNTNEGCPSEIDPDYVGVSAGAPDVRIAAEVPEGYNPSKVWAQVQMTWISQGLPQENVQNMMPMVAVSRSWSPQEASSGYVQPGVEVTPEDVYLYREFGPCSGSFFLPKTANGTMSAEFTSVGSIGSSGELEIRLRGGYDNGDNITRSGVGGLPNSVAFAVVAVWATFHS